MHPILVFVFLMRNWHRYVVGWPLHHTFSLITDRDSMIYIPAYLS
jgi:hypothetical protein